MEKLRMEDLSTKEMTAVFAGGIFDKFFGPIGIIYNLLAELKKRLKISIFLWRKSCASR